MRSQDEENVNGIVTQVGMDKGKRKQYQREYYLQKKEDNKIRKSNRNNNLSESEVAAIKGKFGAVFASIPAPIVAALYCLLFAYVVYLGLSVPQYFNEYIAINGYGLVHTSARWFNNMVNVPFSSEAFVAAVVAYFLDNTLHYKDRSIRNDRGKHWWDKFRSFKTDSRSEEFYSLPYRLNRYLPSV